MRNCQLSEQATRFNGLFGRRTLFFCAVFYLLGSLLAAEWTLSAPICLFAGVLFACLYGFHRRKAFALSALLIAAFFFSCGITTLYFSDLDADFRRIERSAVTGTVTEVGETASGAHKYKLSSVTAGEARLRHCVYVYADYGVYEPGDIIRAYGAVQQPAQPTYAYDFDARMYHASENVSAVVYADYTEKRGEAANIVQMLRTECGKRIDVLFGERAPTAKAMLIGMDAQIDRALADSYRAAGISHVLCISGLHVNIIISAVLALLRRLKLARKPAIFISMAFLIAYMLLAGGSDSILRAGILNLTLLTSKLFHRRGDLLTALAVGFFVCVMLCPACLFGVGFQLSFGCVFTLVCLGDAFGRGKLCSALGTALCGFLATTAILWNVNLAFSPLTILVNLVAVPYMSVVLIVLLVSLLLFLPTGWVFLGVVGKALLELLDKIATFGAALQFDIAVRAVHPVAILCFFFAVFFLSKYLIAPRGVKLGSTAMMLAVCVLLYFMPKNEPLLRIDFLSHDYADTAIVRDDAGHAIMLDAEHPYAKEYAAAYGISIDHVLLSGESGDALPAFVTPKELADGEIYVLGEHVSVMAIREDDTHMDYLVSCDGENILLYLGCSPKREQYPNAQIVKLSSDGKKNAAFAGNCGAKYVILREKTDSLAAIATQNAGVVTVKYDGNLSVESPYDGRTIFTESDA